EQDELTAPLRALASAALRDEAAEVRRAAAQALGHHPDATNLRALLDARHAADSRDTHLVHVLRMSLRDQFRGGVAWPEVHEAAWNENDLHALADVATGVHDVASARFLLASLIRAEESPENILRYVHHIARYGDPQLDESL